MTGITTSEYRKSALRAGMHDGIPIGLGYFAVSFALGIAARGAGLNAFQSFLASLLCNASAGEYAAFTLIAADATYVELALMTLVANARYLLMSCALSQRAEGVSLPHRMLIGFDVTDELFAVTIARPGKLEPFYFYGAMLMALPGWSVGTALGNIAGDLLPARLTSALGVALYGMFLAVIIPPAKKDKILAGLVAFCFAASFAMSRLPVVSAIPEGTRILILTVVIASAAALIFPRKDEEATA